MSKYSRWWMAVEYKLGWLRELLADQLNFKKNSIGQRVRAHSYEYRVDFIPKITDVNENELLISVQKTKRTIPILRLAKDLSAHWYYQSFLQLPWPPGVNEMPTTMKDDEEYELHVYTKYLLENIFSFFWPKVGDAS
jgi:hypothetical protein